MSPSAFQASHHATEKKNMALIWNQGLDFLTLHQFNYIANGRLPSSDQPAP